MQTVDFFTPIVDDPEAFGAIAAANALSDVYAMGGRPLTALSIAAFPPKDFPPAWAAAIFRGGATKLAEAGCALLGGHTVRDAEVKFGYAITGVVEPGEMLTNAGAKEGDALVLTKALGTGVIATAQKNARAPEGSVLAATASMRQLNADAAAAARRHKASAATDITGFGLAGHALGMARESNVGFEFEANAWPLLPDALELAESNQAGGLKANQKQYASLVDEIGALASARRALLYDPQTSGGLLISIGADKLAGMLRELPGARVVGRVMAEGRGRLRIRA